MPRDYTVLAVGTARYLQSVPVYTYFFTKNKIIVSVLYMLQVPYLLGYGAHAAWKKLCADKVKKSNIVLNHMKPSQQPNSNHRDRDTLTFHL